MTLKQIIIVGEDGSKIEIQSSAEPCEVKKLVDGKPRLKLSIDRPLSLLLKQIIDEEWRVVRELGARLVTRKMRPEEYKIK